jgi:hypothetical protein
MTVQELIDILQKQDKQNKVYIESNNGKTCPVALCFDYVGDTNTVIILTYHS